MTRLKLQPETKIGDRDGKIIAQISPEFSVIPWRLNQWSKITLSLNRRDPKLKPEFFTPGNRIILTFDNGLPNWGGVLDYPEEWDPDSYKITAYSPEWILQWRTTDRGRYFERQAAGEIATALLQEANGIADTGIQVRKMVSGITAHSVEYHFKDLYKIYTDSLAKISGEEFWIDTVHRDGRIYFELYWEVDRGAYKGDKVLLTEGRNISDLTLRKQGPIVNYWSLAGSGDSWGPDRLYAFSQSPNSISRYGLRMDAAIYSDVVMPETLNLAAESKLRETQYATNRWSVKALNISPALFASYDVGDTVRMIAPSYGWDGSDQMIRVISRLYDPTTGECILIVEEDTDPHRDGQYIPPRV